MKKNYFFSFLLTCSLILITNLISINANAQKIPNNKIANNDHNINEIYPIVYNDSNYAEPVNLAKDLYLENEPSIQVFKSKDVTLHINNEELELMAKVVHAESKGEPYKGKVAVASVILNRVLDPNFPNSISGVITQKNAFSCVRNGKIDAVPNSDSYKAVLDAIKGNDPTNKALYFYNPDIATCNWMHGIQKRNVQSIGHHVFFEV
ncbi:MAG: cell wall hydrolase [Sarcina sp.]